MEAEQPYPIPPQGCILLFLHYFDKSNPNFMQISFSIFSEMSHIALTASPTVVAFHRMLYFSSIKLQLSNYRCFRFPLLTITVNFNTIGFTFSSSFYKVERNNGARCFRVAGEAGESIHPHFQIPPENGYRCGFLLLEKMASMEVLWMRYLKQ